MDSLLTLMVVVVIPLLAATFFAGFTIARLQRKEREQGELAGEPRVKPT